VSASPSSRPGLLGEQVAEGLVVAIVLEEGFVGAHHLGVLSEPLADAGAKADDLLDAVGWEKCVAEDLVGMLADAVDTARALEQADDRPGEVVIDDHGRVLEVLAFAEDVGRYEDAQLLIRRNLLIVARGAEAPGKPGRVLGPAGGRCDAHDTPRAELLDEVVDRVRELGEDEHLLGGVVALEQLDEAVELGVALRVPLAARLEDPEEGLGVGREVLGQLG
jgi:hypothetical protein